jgi:hypothetical protein
VITVTNGGLLFVSGYGTLRSCPAPAQWRDLHLHQCQ